MCLLQSCSFGYHAGGWGKPPVDENGKPLYGDVFGTQSSEFQVSSQAVCQKYFILFRKRMQGFTQNISQ